MIKVKIEKAKLNSDFTAVNNDILRMAVSELKPCGLKVFLYLANNKDGYEWTLNSRAFGNWLMDDYEKNGRSIRRTLNDGIEDLKEHGYLRELGDEEYVF